MKRWLARLSFAFIALGIVMFYEAWRGMTGRTEEPLGRVWILTLFTLGILLFILGGMGIRERHR